MSTVTFARSILRLLLLINCIAAGAAAVVLVVAPGAIPAIVGISITPSANLLAYLLAAAELAIACLCVLAIRSGQRETDLQAVTVLVVFHVTSAAAGLMVVWSGESALVLWNVVARAVIVVALTWSARVALAR
ncbi:hypothetical protein [Parvibaculum sp.]|uniref:hypothetical protein n=1 Tax=Parvibaculum sp. TaxID=2024848 RepID=UPI000C9048C0|nr:hypothetical protein [Parvibaculum sp.]MAB14123.1 hypothetical protein [Parvibaculum sp.]